MKTALFIAAYAVMSFVVYAVARLFFLDDDDEGDSIACWAISIFWPATLPCFLLTAVISWISEKIDRLLFSLRDRVSERIESRRKEERGKR